MLVGHGVVVVDGLEMGCGLLLAYASEFGECVPPLIEEQSKIKP